MVADQCLRQSPTVCALSACMSQALSRDREVNELQDALAGIVVDDIEDAHASAIGELI